VAIHLISREASPKPCPPNGHSKQVFFGARAVSSTSKELLAICNEKNIPVWQMRMSNDKYELLADPINSVGGNAEP
jgi:hypothetical protein